MYLYGRKKTLNAKEHEAPEAKFSKDFDNFMGGLNGTDLLDSEPIQINPEFLNPNDNREFINYLNNLETLDEFDNLEEWSDDIDLFMKGLLNPDKLEELWHISKAKKMSDDFQSHQKHQQEHTAQPTAQRDDCATTQTPHASDDVALRARMGLPPTEPTYCALNIPFRLQNLATVYREATTSKILIESEKDLDFLLLIGQEQVSGYPAALATDQTISESEEGKPITSHLTIKRPQRAKPSIGPTTAKNSPTKRERPYSLLMKKKAPRTHLERSTWSPRRRASR